mgnify:CR=1 FL=1
MDVRWDISRERPLGGLLEAVLRPLGGCLGVVGGLLGYPWGFSEAPRGLLGASSGRRIELSVYVPPLGPLLGLSGDYLGHLLGRFKALLGRLGTLSGRLGALLGAPGAVSKRRKLEKAIT